MKILIKKTLGFIGSLLKKKAPAIDVVVLGYIARSKPSLFIIHIPIQVATGFYKVLPLSGLGLYTILGRYQRGFQRYSYKLDCAIKDNVTEINQLPSELLLFLLKGIPGPLPLVDMYIRSINNRRTSELIEDRITSIAKALDPINSNNFCKQTLHLLANSDLELQKFQGLLDKLNNSDLSVEIVPGSPKKSEVAGSATFQKVYVDGSTIISGSLLVNLRKSSKQFSLDANVFTSPKHNYDLHLLQKKETTNVKYLDKAIYVQPHENTFNYFLEILEVISRDDRFPSSMPLLVDSEDQRVFDFLRKEAIEYYHQKRNVFHVETLVVTNSLNNFRHSKKYLDVFRGNELFQYPLVLTGTFRRMSKANYEHLIKALQSVHPVFIDEDISDYTEVLKQITRAKHLIVGNHRLSQFISLADKEQNTIFVPEISEETLTDLLKQLSA